jgi:hypothetical protein
MASERVQAQARQLPNFHPSITSANSDKISERRVFALKSYCLMLGDFN